MVDFSTDTLQGYPAEGTAPLKWQKDSGVSMSTGLASAVEVNWVTGVTHKTISDIQCGHLRYRGVVDNGAGLPDDVNSKAIDQINDIIA